MWKFPYVTGEDSGGVFVLIASIPCVLGYNLWYFETMLPNGSVGHIKEFLVSNLLLPLGSLVYLLFCATKWGGALISTWRTPTPARASGYPVR